MCMCTVLTCYDLLIMLLLQSCDDTALNKAMKGGHTEVVQYLLSQSAKVSTCNIHIAICDWRTKVNHVST